MLVSQETWDGENAEPTGPEHSYWGTAASPFTVKPFCSFVTSENRLLNQPTWNISLQSSTFIFCTHVVMPYVDQLQFCLGPPHRKWGHQHEDNIQKRLSGVGLNRKPMTRWAGSLQWLYTLVWKKWSCNLLFDPGRGAFAHTGAAAFSRVWCWCCSCRGSFPCKATGSLPSALSVEVGKGCHLVLAVAQACFCTPSLGTNPIRNV